MYAIPTRLFRTGTTRGSITPPLPSPPKIAPPASIASTTFASPVGARRTSTPAAAAMSSIIREVARFVAILPLRCRSTSAVARANVYSSPINRPFSSTMTSRSASGSWAKPRAALCLSTDSPRPVRFFSMGSGSCANRPLGSALRCATSQPSRPSSIGVTTQPEPLMLSSTTLNRLEAISVVSQTAQNRVHVQAVRFAAATGDADLRRWLEREISALPDFLERGRRRRPAGSSRLAGGT